MKLRTFKAVLEALPDIDEVDIHDEDDDFYVIVHIWGSPSVSFDSRTRFGRIPARAVAERLEDVLEAVAEWYGRYQNQAQIRERA